MKYPLPGPWFIFCLLIWAGGCLPASGPLSPPPPRDVPAAWDRGAGGEAPSPGWWESFGDAGLNRAVGETLANNPDLQAAAARLEEARSLAVMAGADLWPQAEGGLSAQRARREGNGGNTHETSLGVGLDISWEVDLWGRIRSGRLAALAEADSAGAELEAARLSLAGQAAKAYLAAVESGLQAGLARSTVENHQATADLVERRYREGLKPALDYRLALANLARAKSIQAERDLAHKRALRQVEVLMGRYPAGVALAGGGLPTLPGPVPGGLPMALLERRPDLAAAKAGVYAAHHRLAAARAALLPRLTLTASGGTASNALRDLADPGSYGVWSLAAGLLAPIFQGGRLEAEVALEEARRDQALAAWAGTALTAFQEVESALDGESFLAGREEALAEYARQSLGARTLAEGRYREGLGDFTTLLSAQLSALEAQSQYLDVKRVRLANRVDLFLALGGGYVEPPLEGNQP